MFKPNPDRYKKGTDTVLNEYYRMPIVLQDAEHLKGDNFKAFTLF